MLGWGAAYVPSFWLLERWPALAAAAARMGLAGLVLLAGLAAFGRPLRPGVGAGALAALALTQTVAFYAATYYGIAHAGAGIAAVLANTDPLFVAALAALVLGERLAGRQWAGLALGLVGAALASWRGPLWPPTPEPAALVVLGGALAWSLGTIAAARGLRREGDPLALAAWQMTLGGAILGLLALPGLVGAGAPPLGGREGALVAFLALVGSAAPTACFYLALQRAPAARVSAWFCLVPLVGVLSAWPALGERPGPRLGLGLVAVVGGLWLVLRPPRRADGRAQGAVGRLAPPP
jgi:drug/metabolite transporter (DMT)-like permease